MNRLMYIIIAFLISVIVFSIFLHDPGITGYERAMFGDIIYGKAYKPFVYRVLLPISVRCIASAIPVDIKESINQSIVENKILCEFIPIKWEKQYLTEYFIASILMYIMLCGSVFALRYLFKGIYRAPIIFLDSVSLIALIVLPTFFVCVSYLYDIPNLFLFTLALGLLIRRKWWLFLFVFIVASFNKETTVLLTMIFAIYFFKNRQMSKKLYINLVIIQIFVLAIIKIFLFYIFRDNPGSFVEFHLIDYNIRFLKKAYSLTALLPWIVVAFLLFYKWKEKHGFLRKAFLIIIPLLGLTLLFGWLEEFRDYYEIYPIAILLMTHSVMEIFWKNTLEIKEN